MNQRYEILFKHNEFLQEYIGRDMKISKMGGHDLVHSSTMRDITRRILKEHWKHADVPVSPAKVVLWSNDKNGYIKQISASHLLFDRKEKIVFSDLLNQNFGNLFAALLGAYNSVTKTASMTDVGGIVNTMNVTPNAVVGNWFNTGLTTSGLVFSVGKGTQAGNLRAVSNILTPFTVVPENASVNCGGNAVFNPTTGIVSNGTSFSSGEVGTITEVATATSYVTSLSALKTFTLSYDLVNFPIAISQLVNVAIVVQL